MKRGVEKMIIRKLDYEAYKGQKYQTEIVSDRYLSIEPSDESFDICWVMSGEPLRMSINDVMLEDWLDHPAAYGKVEQQIQDHQYLCV